MAVSNWYLYIGMFLCCTGILLPLGIFYIVWWFWHRHEDIEKSKSNFTQNNYFVNTGDSDGGVGGFEMRDADLNSVQRKFMRGINQGDL